MQHQQAAAQRDQTLAEIAELFLERVNDADTMRVSLHEADATPCARIGAFDSQEDCRLNDLTTALNPCIEPHGWRNEVSLVMRRGNRNLADCLSAQ